MNDSRVVVLGIRAEKAAQGRVLGLLKIFLDCSQRDERTDSRGCSNSQEFKWSSIYLAVFPVRGWYITFHENSL